MTAKHDAKLNHDKNYYDISFDDSGNLETEDSFNSAIINTILSDERASASEVPISKHRGGWIGNLDSDEIIGSRFWVYNQQRLRQVEINLIKSEVSRALQRTFVDSGIAISQRVYIQILGDRINFVATINRPDDDSTSKYLAIWSNTGATGI